MAKIICMGILIAFLSLSFAHASFEPLSLVGSYEGVGVGTETCRLGVSLTPRGEVVTVISLTGKESRFIQDSNDVLMSVEENSTYGTTVNKRFLFTVKSEAFWANVGQDGKPFQFNVKLSTLMGDRVVKEEIVKCLNLKKI
jgi:hypothetical protein